ncbi:MAG: hypothetical protein ACYS80_16355 [Planctomycetota bacterium]
MNEINELAPVLGQKYVDWIPRSDMSYFYWTFFEVSNFTTLPYAGGLVDQPDWIMFDFSAYIEITEYNELLIEHDELTKRMNSNV